MPLRLVPPSAALRTSFLLGLRAFQEEGLPWWQGDAVALALDDFDAYVAAKLAEARRTEGAKTHLWGIEDGAFVGRIGIFHELTPALRRSGGHIGYDTVPSARGRGVATEMLRQALPVARSIGLEDVLLTCDAGHVASIRVIEANGGRPCEGELPGKRYYRIPTSDPEALATEPRDR